MKLDLLNDIDMLINGKKGIKGGICHAIHWYTKANNKYLKDDHKNKDSSLYLNYSDMNNLHGQEVSQKPPLDGFKWV